MNIDLIVSSAPDFDFSKLTDNFIYGNEERNCDCLPDCETTTYKAETSSGILDRTFSSKKQ